MAVSPHFVVCRTAGKIAAWTIFGGSEASYPSEPPQSSLLIHARIGAGIDHLR